MFLQRGVMPPSLPRRYDWTVVKSTASKRVFGFDKVRYRGIAKNHHRLCAKFALVNLSMHRERLAVLG